MYVLLLFFEFLFFEGDGDHRDLHVLTHSFPTRRSSDLLSGFESRSTVRRGSSASRPSASRSGSPTNGKSTTSTQPAPASVRPIRRRSRSEEHTSELQSLMRISYAVFCLKKKNDHTTTRHKTKQVDKKHATDDRSI